MHIAIDKEKKISLSKQIYRLVKNDILTGRLVGDVKLPSSRALASELNVARNTVIEAYEQLMAEGYVYAKNGSGTYVSRDMVILDEKPDTSVPKKTGIKVTPKVKVSFRTGVPDLDRIPIKKWGHLYHKISLDMNADQMDYQNTFGEESLRSHLAQYLNCARGTNVRPENILITNGAAQSFNLLSRLIAPNEYALVENPLSYGLLYTLQQNGVTLVPMELDEDGMMTESLPKDPPKLIFTTPSHQFPLGSILTASRRVELIRYVKDSQSYIVEDDYDSEFRFEGNPVESMQYLAPDRVIYVGTFSKTLMPALRIGYMVLPDALCGIMHEAKYVSDIHSPILEQLVLSEFISSGAFQRHIHQMQKVYKAKRNHLIYCLKKVFQDQAHIFGDAAGLHFGCAFEGVAFDLDMLKQIEQVGIEISSVDKHLIKNSFGDKYKNVLLFGYGNTPMEKMAEGVELLASIIGV